MKVRNILPLTVAMLLATIPCFAQKTIANAVATDVTIHKFHPKGQAGGATATTASATTVQKGTAGISETAIAQIQAIQQDKATFSPAQRKIDSQLIYTVRMLQNRPVVPGLQYVETDVDLDQNDNLVVDIVADVTPDLLKQMTDLGVKIMYANAKYRSIRAAVPPIELERVAAFNGVKFVSKMQEATTGSMRSLSGGGLRSAGRVAREASLRSFLNSVLAARNPLMPAGGLGAVSNAYNSGQGSQASEGDITHRVSDARNAFGIDGTGLKIGVLSDGVSNLAASQALGDLGTVTVLPGQTGSGDEGTAMLEIVHDLAPGAQLYFATAFTSITSFAQNIRDLRAAGCDIIVDDVFYYAESVFQDGQGASVVSLTNGGVVAQAVNDVTADGALYFSSAGNSGNLDDNTAGVWEGDFAPGALPTPLAGAGVAHSFGVNSYDTIVASGGPIILQWSDPLGGAANDYDLYVLDPTGTSVVAISAGTQDGTQDPIEAVGSSADVAGNLIVIAKFSGADRFLHLNNNRGVLEVATSGQTHGHSAGADAFGVAAVPAVYPLYYPSYMGITYPMGPFPNYFSSADVVEGFSSDGPRRLFFQADGTAYTPGNLSSTGGIVRQKPDLAAADGVSVTGVGGFGSPFYGTSAAAPHAAAIAALLKSAQPTLTNAQVRTTLTSTAIDIMASGVDRNSGAGIINAFEAVRSLGITGVANPDIASVSATDNPGNGNGIVEAGEGGLLAIQLRNTGGVVDATNITATLTSSTPGVIITQPNTSAYANLPALTGVGSNLSPFQFTLASDYPCGQNIDFTLTLSYTGGPSPTRALNFKVSTEPAPVSLSEVLDTNPPTVAPPFSGATGTQTQRLFRTGAPSVCGVPSTFPGVAGATGSRQFDSYTFTACHDTCANVTMSGPNSINMFTAMYSPAYNPADLSSGYAGDPGVSAAYAVEYGVSVVAGTTYTVVVHDVPVGAASGSNYNLTISGCAVNCATPNQLPVALVHDVTATITDSTYTASASIDNGSYDPEGGSITLTQSPAPPYAIGITPVTLTVVDNKGAAAQATANVTVQDVPVTFALTSGLGFVTGVSRNGSVGIITHTIGQASQLTATVTWGDGTSSSGTVTGSAPTFTVAAAHTYSTAGTYALSVLIQDSHGGTATQSTSVVAANADFVFSTTVPTLIMLQGQSVTRSITITPNPAPFNAAINLSCSSDIHLGGCTISPSSVTPGSNPATVNMVVTTTGPHGYAMAPKRNSTIYASLMFGALGLVGITIVGTRRSRKKVRVIVVAGLLAIAAIGLVNCGGHAAPATNLGTYNVTVTATSGSISHSTSTIVTVRQP